jgi:hypothetical protein
MKDLEEASYIIGIEIYRDRSRGILALSQKALLKKCLNITTYKITLQVLLLLSRVTNSASFNVLKVI